MPISQVVKAAVSGMMGHRLSLDVIANNLANVNTAGFKSGRVNFTDALYQASRMATSNRDLRVGHGVRPVEIQPAFTQGSLQQTDQPTDLAIYGDGFFRIQLPDGTVGYTRNGALRIDADGRLVSADGMPLADNIQVQPGDAGSLSVDPDGRVRVTRPGETQSQLLGQIQLARFNNPEGLEALGQTLYRESQNSGGAQAGLPNTAGFGQIVQRTLETSNVSMADEMASLVVAQRAYGFSVKVLQTLDEMLGMANNIRGR